MSEEYYEKFWNCSHCGTEGISALRNMRCMNCGNSKPEQSGEYYSTTLITDKEGLELAMADKNWECSFCGSINLDRNNDCSGCGASKGAEVEGSFKSKSISGLTPNTDSHVDGLTSSGTTYNAKPSQVKTVKRPTINKKQLAIVAAVFISVIAGIILLVSLNTHEYEGAISGFKWTSEVRIEEYTRIHESGWSNPTGSYNVTTERKIHHYDPIYETRTEYYDDVSYVDNGNGSTKKVTTRKSRQVQEKVGEEPVYQTYYTYDIDRWQSVNSLVNSGPGKEPVFKEYTLVNDVETYGTNVGAQKAIHEVTYYIEITYVDKDATTNGVDDMVSHNLFYAKSLEDKVMVKEVFGKFKSYEFVE